MINDFGIKAAVERAERDWASESAVVLVIGTLVSGSPTLPRLCSFYLDSLGCVATPELAAYADSYNARIHELVEERGLPGWCPRSRLPDRFESLQLLAEAEPFDGSSLRDRKERRLAGVWYPGAPAVLRRLEDRALILLGGDLNPRASRVDVLDLRADRWMATYEYLRKHAPRMPWDP